MFYVNQVMRFGKLIAVFQPNPADAKSTIATVMIALAVGSSTLEQKKKYQNGAGAAEPGAVAGAARQQLVQHRQLDQRRPAELRPQPHQGDRRDPRSRLILAQLH